ncbi:hypothetical protein [Methanolobus halotolerans]|uniref:Uncharacterized protein n=1 Tax=Methanolobus halotolerans TaxID=2052935 RepID=A0A4E0Q807_9EURY|nr:hypothetical protein [Methanolobus halotolerans]TGC07475.1 hypothetical protein CUN85_10810 [Methanolobus halotolerans]
MEPIIRRINSLEVSKEGKHCTIIGNVADVSDEYVLKLAEWATTLWDYSRITMWKKSDSMEPGYFIRDSADGKYKLHVLDDEELEALFGAARKDSPKKLPGWEKKELVAYVDWFVDL